MAQPSKTTKLTKDEVDRLIRDFQTHDNKEAQETLVDRETILYAGTIALNGTLQMGYFGDWLPIRWSTPYQRFMTSLTREDLQFCSRTG